MPGSEGDRLNVIALISGGKDSLVALHVAVGVMHCRLVGIAHMRPAGSAEETDSYMFQSVGSRSVDAIAEALMAGGESCLYEARTLQGSSLNTELVYVPPPNALGVVPETSGGASGGGEERVGGEGGAVALKDEVEDLYECLRVLVSRIDRELNLPVDGVVSGAILSAYQGLRVENVCQRLGLRPVAPLWGWDQRLYVLALIHFAREFRFALIKYACPGFAPSILGRGFEDPLLQATLDAAHTKWRINVAGEGGEYETITLQAPALAYRLTTSECQNIRTDDEVAYQRITLQRSAAPPPAAPREGSPTLGVPGPPTPMPTPPTPPELAGPTGTGGDHLQIGQAVAAHTSSDTCLDASLDTSLDWRIRHCKFVSILSSLVRNGDFALLHAGVPQLVAGCQSQETFWLGGLPETTRRSGWVCTCHTPSNTPSHPPDGKHAPSCEITDRYRGIMEDSDGTTPSERRCARRAVLGDTQEKDCVGHGWCSDPKCRCSRYGYDTRRIVSPASPLVCVHRGFRLIHRGDLAETVEGSPLRPGSTLVTRTLMWRAIGDLGWVEGVGGVRFSGEFVSPVYPPIETRRFCCLIREVALAFAGYFEYFRLKNESDFQQEMENPRALYCIGIPGVGIPGGGFEKKPGVDFVESVCHKSCDCVPPDALQAPNQDERRRSSSSPPQCEPVGPEAVCLCKAADVGGCVLDGGVCPLVRGVIDILKHMRTMALNPDLKWGAVSVGFRATDFAGNHTLFGSAQPESTPGDRDIRTPVEPSYCFYDSGQVCVCSVVPPNR